MEYKEILFRGGYLAKRRIATYENGMKFAAFTGWQALRSQGFKDSYEKYLVDLGLKKKKKASKKQLELEERIAMQTANRILREGATGGKTSI
jgi:hypothetical protein|tara:strand:+ start:7985 stop:8260 length:276 start_codon:yes stop_codon:yes gene_type:complete